MSTVEEITVKGDGISLSLLIWRRFRRQMPGLVERALDLNHGLSDVGAHIPVGTVVRIPIDAPEKQPEERPVVRLWD